MIRSEQKMHRNKLHMGHVSIAIVSIFLVAACGTEEGTGGTATEPDVATDDVGVDVGAVEETGDVQADTAVAEDVSTVEDTATAPEDTGAAVSDADQAEDASTTSEDAPTTPEDGGTVTPDGGTVTPDGGGSTDSGVSPACAGKKGCTCETSSDCKAGPCVQVDGSKVCVEAAQVNCAPCLINKDCEVPGADGAACVAGSSIGSFCGLACKADTDCPTDYACKDGADIEATKGKWCVKDKPATCKCSPWAISVGAATACNIAGKVGGKDATCSAPVNCKKDGTLSACAAQAPAPEKCDGIDNDCNGKADDTIDCNDNNLCTTDVCEGSNGCQNKNNVLGCDDGKICTGKDNCKDGKCAAGAAKDCDDKNACTNDKCDAGKGCVFAPIAATVCDDNSVCTKDSCDVAKGCVNMPNLATACDDNNVCTADSCDKIKGCQNTATPGNCDDGTVCVQKESCKDGKCQGVAQNCDGGVPCTKYSCDAKAGCESVQLPDGASCSDNNNCTEGDSCTSGKCKSLKPSNCDDGSVCTTESCDVKTGCTFKNNDAKCSDGSVCTENDTCKLGKCASGKVKDCADNNACTKDGCHLTKGCTWTPDDGAPCQDGDKCTTGNVCKGEKCQVGVPNLCDDGNPCTVGKCNDADGKCALKLKVCTDALDCTLDKCDFKTGKCISQFTEKCKTEKFKLPWSTKFDCGDVVNGLWTKGKAVGGPTWEFDATPKIPAPFSPKCALNYNNGATYQCSTSGATKVDGAIDSPDFDIAGFSNPWVASFGFKLGGKWSSGSSYNLDVRVSFDSGKNWSLPATLDHSDLTKYNDAKFTVVTKGAKVMRVRFHFYTTLCTGLKYAGPFIDDFWVADGGCKGAKECDDNNICTADSCNVKTGACVNTKASVGAACSDGNLCTSKDACNAAGVCKGVNKLCNDDKVCTTDACDVKTGKCGFKSKLKDASCYTYCTGTGKCDGATTCVGNTPKAEGTTCTPTGTPTPCAETTCQKFVCKATGKDKKDGTSCSDANGCTGPDKCGKGACVGAPLKSKCDDSDPCTLDSCHAKPPSNASTECKYSPAKDGTACVDGVVCTTADTCQKGQCKGINKCVVTTVFKDNFLCADKGKGWTLSGNSTTVKWGVDGTPALVAPRSPKCSLNYNNGTNYPGTTKGSALGAKFKVASKDMQATFWQYHGVESGASSNNYDKRFVEIHQAGKVVKSVQMDNSKDIKKWSQYKLDLAAYVGKEIQLGFRFDSVDSISNGTPGWFIDDVWVGSTKFPTVVSCKIDAECLPDNDKCTIEKCDLAKKTCTSVVDKNCTVVKRTLPYKTDFQCGGAAGKEWNFDNQSKGAGWNLDASPNPPGYMSAKCSLNYNDGTNYKCKDNQLLKTGIGVQGYVTSPVFDAKAAGKTGAIRTRFNLGGKWSTGTSYNLDLEITLDGGNTWKLLKTFDHSNAVTWTPTQVDLPGASGSTFQLRFRFYTTFCTGISYPGAFIDDLQVFDASCQADKQCDDGNGCTLDKCDKKTGVCTNVAVGGTVKCNDGNACTISDKCSGGACVGISKSSCADGNPCTSDGCDAATGKCAYKATAKGASCSDLDSCSTGDACDGAGKCVGAAKDDGAYCSEYEVCYTTRHCQKGKCVGKATPRVAGYGCSDNETCNGLEKCDGAGACKNVGPAKICNDNNSCTVDACVKNYGCRYDKLKDNTSCDDGNVCTANDACTQGKCAGTGLKDNTACDDGDACSLKDVCVGLKCGGISAQDGKKCTDGKPCTLGDACKLGKCTAKTTMSCNDGETCTADACDAKTGGCVYTKRYTGYSCTDGDSCSTESCKDGKCTATGKKADGATCFETEVCKATRKCLGGKCTGSGADLNDGTICTDNNNCTTGDKCAKGKCEPGAVVKCDDKSSCTADACKPGAGCQHTPLKDGATCNDGNACTVATTCYQGACAGKQVQQGTKCDDGEACSIDDKCINGACSGKNKLYGTGCADGKKCTIGDYCKSGKCVGAAKPCNDGDTCTNEKCDEATGGCVFVKKTDGVFCSDGDSYCTTNDACLGGKCIGKPATDGKACYGHYCTSGEQCKAGKCEPGKASNEGKSCSVDGDPCMTDSTCAKGKCAVGSKPLCNDQNPCTLDVCHKAATTKSCSFKALADNAACDDGDMCTASTCKVGKCLTTNKNLCVKVWSDSFKCDDKGKGWTLTPLVSKTGWAVDATPAIPVAKSPKCSLNYNNGTNYNTGVKTAGSATSPKIKLPANSKFLGRMWQYNGVESNNNYDKRFIEVLVDGKVAGTFQLNNGSGGKAWTFVAVKLDSFAGKEVQLRLRFDSIDNYSNSTPGWFVDDIEIVTVP
jgi:hypothetical protein